MSTFNNKLLISSSAKQTIKESVNLAKELNTGIEISRLPFYKDKKLKVPDVVEQLKSDLEGFNNRITLHAMFSDANISSQDPLIQDIAILRFYQSLNVGEAIKADTILFHTGNKGTLHYGSQESFKEKFVLFWKDFIKYFEINNITAVIENVFETTPEYCLNLIKEINSPYLKLALDIGHVNLYSPETNIMEWIDKYGDKLYHLHIHNNFKKNDDHSNLENGTLNYKEILSKIKDMDINPSFVLEMFTEEDIRKSVKIFNEIMN